MATAAAPKPSLRGISHGIATLCALIAGVWLVRQTQDERAQTAVSIYVLTLVMMFAVSSVYHLPNWSPGIRQWWRRADHAAIFMLIGGTSTPFCQLVLPPDAGSRMLLTMWIGAALGMGQSLFFVRAPKALSAVLYIGVGCLAFPYLPHLIRGLGAIGVSQILVGGLVYAVGAGVYSLKKPNPFPRIFGYHEIFHLLVIVGAIFHFLAVYGVVKPV